MRGGGDTGREGSGVRGQGTKGLFQHPATSTQHPGPYGERVIVTEAALLSAPPFAVKVRV